MTMYVVVSYRSYIFVLSYVYQVTLPIKEVGMPIKEVVMPINEDAGDHDKSVGGGLPVTPEKLKMQRSSRQLSFLEALARMKAS